MCGPCRDAARAQRASDRAIKPDFEPEPVVVAPQESADRRQDLMDQRDALWEAINWARGNDISRLAGLSKELREVWAEIDQLGAASGEDAFAEFMEAGNVARIDSAKARKSSRAG